MHELSLTTPALLFSAISLIMLAYTNRFLAYAAVIRNLHDKFLKQQDPALIRQIKNLKRRLNLTRWMQIFGISSLLGCVLSMFLVYVTQQDLAVWVFRLFFTSFDNFSRVSDSGNQYFCTCIGASLK
jgi:hypothetical protein